MSAALLLLVAAGALAAVPSPPAVDPVEASVPATAPAPPAIAPAAPVEASAPAAVPAPPAIDPCPLALVLLEQPERRDEIAAQLRAAGREAAPAVATALVEGHAGVPPAVALLETLAAVGGDWREAAVVRPFVFSDAPELAEAATHALIELDGARAASTLERILREKRPFGQTLIAIHGLGEIDLRSSFAELARFAEDRTQDPVLRAEAARLLPELDVPKTRKWLKALKIPAGTDAFFQAAVDRLFRDMTQLPERDRQALR